MQPDVHDKGQMSHSEGKVKVNTCKVRNILQTVYVFNTFPLYHLQNVVDKKETI